MAKRRAKNAVKQQSGTVKSSLNASHDEEPLVEKQEDTFNNWEVERRIAASTAIRDVEIEHMLTELCLLRSNFSMEQLQTPALQFFKDNLPNLSVVRNENDVLFEVEWKDKGVSVSFDHGDERNINAPGCADPKGMCGTFVFSSKSDKKSFLGAENLLVSDFVLEEPSGSQMSGLHKTFHIPGMSNQRLSTGMTPKTIRLPKQGEILLSVHGSPLGVYKGENMEAIHESGEN